jgi:hypothetical protein
MTDREQERAAVVAKRCENCRHAKALNVADPGEAPEPPKPTKWLWFTKQPHWLAWDFHTTRVLFWAARKDASLSVLCCRYPTAVQKRKTSICGEFDHLTDRPAP